MTPPLSWLRAVRARFMKRGGPRRCLLCGGREASLRLRDAPWDLWECRICGLLFTARDTGAGGPRPSVDPRFEHETWTGKPYIESGEELAEYYQPLLAQLEQWAPPGRLLDIGCGLGFFMEAARKRGWDVVGIDTSSFAAEYAATTYGLKVTQTTLEAASFEQASFDAAALVHSLEHFDDPLAGLREVARLLRPQGVAFIETPNIDSDDSRLQGADWWALNLPEHTFLFSPATLALLLHRAGLRLLHMSSPARAPLPEGAMIRAWAERPARLHLTRAEVMQPIAEALGLPTPKRPGSAYYTDCHPEADEDPAAGALFEAGLLPWPPPLLRPGTAATRGEAAMILASGLGLAGKSREPSGLPESIPGPFFPDVPAPSPDDRHEAHPAWAHIHLLRQAGLVTGFPDGRFRPDKSIVQTELDALLDRIRQWREEHR